MFNLNQQERLVLLFLAAVIFFGSLLQVAYKHSPQVRQFLTFSERLNP